jgi:hypothetical protein
MSTRNFVHPQELDEEDLVADCAPYADAHFLKKAAHFSNPEKFDSVCDSGVDLRSFGSAYGSMQERSLQEKTVPDTDLLEEKLGHLRLENPKQTTNDSKCPSDSKYSLDDGYLSYQSTETEAPANYQISPEVVELYNQDVDGDS